MRAATIDLRRDLAGMPHELPLIESDLSGCDVEYVRRHLPNAGRVPPAPVPPKRSAPAAADPRATRFAAVLARQAAFLTDRTGTIEPPERWEVIEACRFASELLRDGVASRA